MKYIEELPKHDRVMLIVDQLRPWYRDKWKIQEKLDEKGYHAWYWDIEDVLEQLEEDKLIIYSEKFTGYRINPKVLFMRTRR